MTWAQRFDGSGALAHQYGVAALPNDILRTACNCFNFGSACPHGPHYEAQKSRSTTLPFNSVKGISCPGAFPAAESALFSCRLVHSKLSSS